MNLERYIYQLQNTTIIGKNKYQNNYLIEKD